VALAEDDGDVIERYWYEPYGSVTFADSAGVERTEDNALNKTLLFQGRRYDPETGFYYYRNRYYSPVLGRFLQRDPAGYQDGMSLYVAGRIIVCTDPYGLQSLVDRWLNRLRGKSEFEFGGKEEFGRDAGKVPKFEWRAPVESTSLPAQVEKAARNLARNAVEDAAPGRNDPLHEVTETIADVVYGAKGRDEIGSLIVPGEEDDRITAAKRGALIAAMIIATLEMTKGTDDGEPRQDKLKPDPDATGAHTVIKRDAQGNITGYETYSPQSNPRNPNQWQSDKRVDLQGKPHFEKSTGQDVPTPHVHEPGGVRPANPDEIP